MGSAATSTAVTHLTSISDATAQQLCTTRAEAAPAAAAPRAGTSSAERAGVAGRRSGADAPLESSESKPRAPRAAAVGGCAFLSQPSGPGCSPVTERAGKPAKPRAAPSVGTAARGGGWGEAVEPLGPEPAREWRFWIPGGVRTAGWSWVGHSGPAAPVPSRFRPFWVTSTPLYRPHLSGAASTAPWGRGRGGDTTLADWAVAAAVVLPRKRSAGVRRGREVLAFATSGHQ